MKALILGNGKLPNKNVITKLTKIGYKFLIAADGGANSLPKLGLIPNIILGDFDSISEETLRFFENKTKLRKIKRQNDTDIEKGIKYAISKGFEDVILLGASGDRLDHTLCNIGNLLKYCNKINLGMLHYESFARPYCGKIKLKTEPGETISFYSFDEQNLITTKGLKYKLKNEPLPFGKRSSTSNIAIKNEMEIISSSKIIVIRSFNTLLKNDFIY